MHHYNAPQVLLQYSSVIWPDELNCCEFESRFSHLYFQCHMNLFDTHFKGTQLYFNMLYTCLCIHSEVRILHDIFSHLTLGHFHNFDSVDSTA